ncbi:50S ribosomal protein L22 [Candidatus Gugararchaeum adminiculabundum]|nr:50S ribosomal protein L22 [Candidatus Gugararchaeum adminiculabundum]
MPNFGYGFKEEKGRQYAYAQRYDVNASYKDLACVCDNVRYRRIEDAIGYLELAAEGKQAVRFRHYNKRLAHRKELGGRKGKFPMLASSYVLDLVRNLGANAEAKGLMEPVIAHISANKQQIYPRTAPRGRWRRNNYETARLEAVACEAKGFEKARLVGKVKTDLKVMKKEKVKIKKEVKQEQKVHEKVAIPA